MRDDETLDFIADWGSRAEFVTSVCTGSLLLGAAGLLKGYRATSHWGAISILKEFGAKPVDGRVVEDRNRLTGGGVTAGMDLGLTVVARLRDEFYAQGVQLMAEYAPQPPFNAGTPATAPPNCLPDNRRDVRRLSGRSNGSGSKDRECESPLSRPHFIPTPLRGQHCGREEPHKVAAYKAVE